VEGKKETYSFINYVISYPKCGRTWLHVALGKVFSCIKGFQDKLILDSNFIYGIDIFPYFYHDHSDKNRSIVENKTKYSSKSIIFLTRDPVDVVWSYYLHCKHRTKKFKGSFSKFIESERYGIEKVVLFYNIWFKNSLIPYQFMDIRYEDMSKNMNVVLQYVVDFIGLENCTKDIIDKSVEFAKFENMRQMERHNYFNAGAMKPLNPIKKKKTLKKRKIRSGKIGEGYKHLSKFDKIYVNKIIEKHVSAKYFCFLDLL